MTRIASVGWAKRKRAHHLKLHVAMVGTAQARLCPPYEASYELLHVARIERELDRIPRIHRFISPPRHRSEVGVSIAGCDQNATPCKVPKSGAFMTAPREIDAVRQARAS
jgi:hypothetical protein